MAEETIRVFSPINKKAHENLTKIAVERRMPLYMLTKAILEWAGDRSVKEIVGLGISIPIYPHELDGRPGDTTDVK